MTLILSYTHIPLAKTFCTLKIQMNTLSNWKIKTLTLTEAVAHFQHKKSPAEK